MIPTPISPATRSDAERALYAAFRDELDDGYIVFHGVAWHGVDPSGRPRDGEADFVIAHPQRGVLVLEVKGGVIAWDPASGVWTSTSRGGHVATIHNPFEQARESKYALRNHLRAAVPDLGRINIGHAVAFPDVVVGNALLGPDKPRQIVLDKPDLANVAGWVGRALAYWQGTTPRREAAAGPVVIDALVRLLANPRQLRPALWGDIALWQKELIELTDQQYSILTTLNRRRRARICGCAGSGKTLIAVEKATRLAASGLHVLLTCFNVRLAQDLRDKLASHTNLTVLTFHDLCAQLAAEAGVLPENKDDRAFYDEQLPEALMQAVDTLGPRFDAIVADEGQDFADEWWVPLQMTLRDPDAGILYIFYDDNQRLYARSRRLPIDDEPFELSANCRSTQRIHRQVMRFYQGQLQPSSAGPEGIAPEVILCDGKRPFVQDLQHVLDRLINVERVPAEHITVLAGARLDWLMKHANVLRPKLSDQLPRSPDVIYCSTVHGFKGLESPVVILTNVDASWIPDWTVDLPRLLYVACSRASAHLIALLSREGGDSAVREAFAADAGKLVP
jgi:hypothetical protein